MNAPALSPIPITSRPVRARLDQVKADMSREFQQRLGRDATWNEVAERLLDAYGLLTESTRGAYLGPRNVHVHMEGKQDDQDHG